jgi:hypothetical protein
VLWYVYLLGKRTTMAKAPFSDESFDVIEGLAESYMQFLYFGLLVLFLLGLRICRFMRVHLGMKALYHVFVDVTKNIIDFAVFAVYIMLVLGGITFAYFQINGGNPLFVEFPDGLSAMARLAFNFLDFHEFENDAVGGWHGGRGRAEGAPGPLSCCTLVQQGCSVTGCRLAGSCCAMTAARSAWLASHSNLLPK